ncbi:phosphatase PAP2 family protein [Streptosporangium sp. NPDC001559]|uniref:phosphatase PAP2 family protein n=1 Tax=Streptosporangium sp. NPDC001559 TaxID=3366187 RepID=UPI0036E1D577
MMARTLGERSRQDSDRRLGMRLTFAVGAVALFSVPFVLLLVLVLISFEPLNDLDETIATGLHAYVLADPGYARLLGAWTDILGPNTWRVLVVAVAAWAWYRGARRPAVWAVVTIAASGVLNVLIKEVVNRARPVLPDPVSWAPGSSFPSGHAMAAATGASVLVLMLLPRLRGPASRAAAWTLAAVLAVFVAYTRVALGVHWFSDVIAGLALGVVVTAGTTAGFERWRREEGRRPAEPYVEGVEPEAFSRGDRE